MERGTRNGRKLLLALWVGLSMAAGAQEAQELEDYELMRKAIQKGDAAGAALLLDRGVPVELVIPHERTPLMDAIRENEPELVHLFLARGADPDLPLYGRRSLWDSLHVSPATEKHQAKTLEILTLLLDAGLPIDAYCDSDEGKTLLMKACSAGNAVLVERLLEKGASISLRNKWHGTTALGYLTGGAPFSRKDVLDCLSLLLDAGADPREYRWGKEGDEKLVRGLWGFLSHLAQTGDTHAMNLVLDRYGHELSLDSEMASAVLAALLPRIHGDADAVRRAVEALVALGAASDVRDERGKPAAFEASHQEAVLALLDAGFPVDTEDDSGYTLLGYVFERRDSFCDEGFVRELARRGVPVDLPDKDGNTPLFSCRTADLVALLLELGADPVHRNAKGSTVLHRLVYRNEAIVSMGLLLDAAARRGDTAGSGALLDARDSDGNSPFLLAVEQGDLATARFLAARGTDVMLRNGEDKGALDLLLAYVAKKVERTGNLEESTLDFVHFLLDCGLDPAQAPLGGDAPLVVALRFDPKGERSFTKALVEAVSKEDVVLARRQLGEERRKGFFENLSWYPGRTAIAVVLPLVICGLSISLREGVFAGNPGANWMVGVNSFLGTTGGLVFAGGLVGGVIGYLLFNTRSAHGMAGIGVAIGIVGMAGLGAIICGIIGSIVSFSPGVLNAYRDNAFLYYLPSGLSLIVSGALLKSIFD